MTFVLLLALILPLQNFASAWSCSAHETGAAAAHHHCANDSGKPQGGEQQHHCGTCCAAAIAVVPFTWTAPRSASPEAYLPSHRPPPKVALDRLDRPPRPIPS
jgi:hypothetical protein